MRTIPKPGGPGVIRVRLLGRREGSASAFRVLGFSERPQNAVDIAEDVRVDILIAQCQRLEGGVRLAEDFEPVLNRQDRVRRCEVIPPVKPVPVPKQDVVVNHEGLHLACFVGHKTHACLVLAYFSSTNLFFCAFDVREHHIPKHCNPVHALGREVLNRTIKGVVGVRSQTLEQ